MTRKRAFAEEITRLEHRDDTFLSSAGQHRKLDGPFFNVQDAVGGIPLQENRVGEPIGRTSDPDSSGPEKRVHVDSRRRLH